MTGKTHQMTARDLSGHHIGKVLDRHRAGFSTSTQALTITGITHTLATVTVTATSPDGRSDEYVMHADQQIEAPR